MIDAIANFEGRIAHVTGAVATGKTEALVRRCATLLKRGEDPARIGVCVASGMAADEFRGRLRGALGNDAALADGVRIARAVDFCVEALRSPAAAAFTGRTPRLLDASEYAFFLEDMKTLGTPVRRMRNMLNFFYAQWAALNPEQDWLEPGEESNARELMRDLLVSYGAMLPQEAPALCAAWLKSDDGKDERGSFVVMLCDDFQNLSRAEQTCLCLMAGDQLIVCGNTNETVSDKGANPFPKGFAEFAALRRNVEEFKLEQTLSDAGIAAMTNALCDADGMEPSVKSAFLPETPHAQGGITVVKWATPEKELESITNVVKAWKAVQGDGFERSLGIFVPNRRWAQTLHKALRGVGIASSIAAAGSRIGGDPRDLSRCAALAAFLKLGLLARNRDIATWRCWCGLGNYLTNSDAWTHLRAYAAEQGIGLYEALEKASDEVADGREPFLRARALTERFDEGRAFIEANGARKGFALARAVGAEGLPEFADVLELMDGDEDALRLEALTRRFFADPKPQEHERQIRIVSIDKAAGLSFDTVIIAGAVDGFVPVRDAFEAVQTDEQRTATMNRQRRVFYSAIGKARAHLLISFFAHADLELAERTKMLVARVRADEGRRIALLRPSCFLEEAGSSCPGTTGGQAFLASLGLD